jgi:hypothetical protein
MSSMGFAWPQSCIGGDSTKCRWRPSVIPSVDAGSLTRRPRCLFNFTLRCNSETEALGWLDLPDRIAARDEALRIARVYRSAMLHEGGDPTDCVIEISDQTLQVIQVVPL